MNPLTVLLSLLVAGILFSMWLGDYLAYRRGTPKERALAGATNAPMRLIVISALVSVGLVVIETIGEYALGVQNEQSTIPWYAIIPMLGAGIVEEILFRGYLVMTGKNGGKGLLLFTTVFFSAVFALVHVHLFPQGSDGNRHLALAMGPAWWTLLLFVNSLWWYFVRFTRHNPERSLLPCFAGHIASNLAVFAIKFAQGFVS